MSPTSVRFTEEMKGFITLDETDPDQGAEQGRNDDTACMFHLTIEIPDIDAFEHDPLQEGTCAGWVGCDVLGGRLPVESGVFNLFLRDESDPRRRTMRYRLRFRDSVGHPLTLVGEKDVKDDPGFDVWSDTTTLRIRILAGHPSPEADDEARIVAAGTIWISVRDFARQMTTFRSSGDGIRRRIRALARFARSFVSDLVDVYGRRARG